MEPFEIAEHREAAWDRFAQTLPVCALCRRKRYTGHQSHTASHQVVCPACKEGLDENEDMVETS